MQSIAQKNKKEHYKVALKYRSLFLKLLTKTKKKRNQTLFSSYIHEVTSSEKMSESIKNSNTRAYKCYKSKFQTNTA